MKDLKVIFMGTPEFCLPVLDSLIKNTNVSLVVSQPDKLVGRKKILTPTPVKSLALENNIEVFQPLKIREDYKRSFPLFVSSISTQIYVNVNKLVVGSCLGMSEVAIYDIGEKVLHLMKLPIQMVAQATFPKISREKNIRFLNRLMFMVAGIVTVGYIIMFMCSKWIVHLFTGEYISEAVTVMRILGLSAILVAFNSFMGGNRLVPFGYSKVYMRVMMQNCIFFLVGMFVLWIGGWINMYSVAGMGVIIELYCFCKLALVGSELKIIFK